MAKSAVVNATNPDDLSLADLQAEAESLRKRINRFRESLGRFFVDKQELIDLMCVAAIAQEPLLLVGPPGTAKSDLVLKFKDALGIEEEDYFEYMLTRLHRAVGDHRRHRHQPAARGDVHPPQAGQAADGPARLPRRDLQVELGHPEHPADHHQREEVLPGRGAAAGAAAVLFAATNEIPEQGELAALKDRFVLKVESRSVQDEYFTELIDAGLQGEAYKGLNQKPWVEGHATLDDLLKANRYLTYLFARKTGDGRGEEENDRQLFFPAEVFNEYQRLVKTLVREDKIFISDRKLVKLYKLFRVRAGSSRAAWSARTTCDSWPTWARRTRRSSIYGKPRVSRGW